MITITQSESVGSAAFNSDWVGSPFTKNLQIMMMRATKPNTITAAKFYDMSLESFTMVLKSSYCIPLQSLKRKKLFFFFFEEMPQSYIFQVLSTSFSYFTTLRAVNEE